MGSLEEGAKNAVLVCMGLKQGEHVLIVTDRAQSENRTGAREYLECSDRIEYLETLRHRRSRPKAVEDLAKANSRCNPMGKRDFLGRSESSWRTSSQTHVYRTGKKVCKTRTHAQHHKTVMEQGMCSDYNEVYALTHKVFDTVKGSNRIEVNNRFGVDLKVDFDRNWKWVPSDGRYYEKGRWGNLPEGEVFTAPKRVNGTLGTNLLGDWFSEKYGNFKDLLSFEIKDSINIDSMNCANEVLRNELVQYLSTDSNSPRASEFALPTNPLLMSLPTIGNLLQDEKARVHIAFGDPYRHETGAPWESKTHIDMLLEACNVKVDGKTIMQNGKYII